MKHPVWIINSTLLVLILCALIFVLFSHVSLPEREDIEPSYYSTIKKEKQLQINIGQIYKADLFGTVAALEIEKKEEELFPLPPEPQVAEIPDLPQPQFLDPLDITLRGIFVVSTDSTKNRTIIADNKTKKEATYKIGDTIGDAQLIRIFGNKIILLRSNGQQEVLFLREQDAKMDSGYAATDEWNLVVQSISGTLYMVDPIAFARAIPDLGQFIEMLHLITAYKQGVSIGCRIGTLTEKSIGTALGLQAGDIITSIDAIPATTMQERLKIYESVLSKKENDKIVVTLMRNQQELTLEYLLKELLPEGAKPEIPENQNRLQTLEAEEKVNIVKQKYKFAPTLEDIRKRERKNMLEKGQAPQS